MTQLGSESGELYRDGERAEGLQAMADWMAALDHRRLFEKAKDMVRSPAEEFADDVFGELVSIAWDYGIKEVRDDADVLPELAKQYGGGSCLDLLGDQHARSYFGISDALWEELKQSPWADQLDEISTADVLTGARRLSYLVEDALSSLHVTRQVSPAVVKQALAMRTEVDLQLTAAWHLSADFVIALSASAARAVQLASLALSSPPSARLTHYLQMLRRAFVLGLDAECVIISRCVLESAVNDAFARKGVPLPDSMRSRIDWSVSTRWLTPGQGKHAHDIWTRGNKVIHEDPTGAGSSARSLEELLSIAATLERVGT